MATSQGRLQGKVACITGSNSGLGRAMALRFAGEGATVICAGRSPVSKDPAEAHITTHDLIKQNGGRSEYIYVLVNDPDSMNELVAEIVKRHHRLDTFVNNAGMSPEINHRQMIWEKSDSIWLDVIDVNLTSKFFGVRAATAQMVKQDPDATGCRGKVINVSSIAGINGLPVSAGYCASQHGIIGLTKTAALDCASHRINVNAICPGSVRTNLNASIFDLPAGQVDPRAAQYPLGFGQPSNIADAALFLASPDSAWVTGQAMIIDGGYTTR